MSGREKNHDLFFINRYSGKTQKVFDQNRNWCSDITGTGVRPFSELMFEVERNLHTLSRIATNHNYNLSRRDMEKLLLYFRCRPDELMTLIPE